MCCNAAAHSSKKGAINIQLLKIFYFSFPASPKVQPCHFHTSCSLLLFVGKGEVQIIGAWDYRQPQDTACSVVQEDLSGCGGSWGGARSSRSMTQPLQATSMWNIDGLLPVLQTSAPEGSSTPGPVPGFAAMPWERLGVAEPSRAPSSVPPPPAASLHGWTLERCQSLVGGRGDLEKHSSSSFSWTQALFSPPVKGRNTSGTSERPPPSHSGLSSRSNFGFMFSSTWIDVCFCGRDPSCSVWQVLESIS